VCVCIRAGAIVKWITRSRQALQLQMAFRSAPFSLELIVQISCLATVFLNTCACSAPDIWCMVYICPLFCTFCYKNLF